MPYTVQSSFDKFYENINLKGDYRATANSRRDRIVSLLGNHFDILEAFGSGSIPRFTALQGKADLDVMVALHFGKHIKDKTPVDVLQSVRDALAEYRNQVRKNGQAVTLYYETWPNVDIVPVSRSVDIHGNVTHYNVPNANTGRWIESNPKEHSEDIEKKAGACGPHFRQLIKMMKAWNEGHGAYLQSFHIEVMALHAFNEQLSDLPWDMYMFFVKCEELVADRLWYVRGYADDYLSPPDRAQARKRLQNARDLALNAWLEGFLDHQEQSINGWKQIFGTKFPSYG